jgi:lysophospholipase L1-like esterase
MSFEIFALGTSNTNSKGVERSKSFTVQLEALLKAEGFDVHVINGGEDGDKPVWMMHRLKSGINENTRLVLFEPGPNDKNKSSNVEDSEKILAKLKEINMPTVYISNRVIQTDEEAEATSNKYGAYYYGPWGKNIPIDKQHRQYDMPGAGGGHMTADGVSLIANYMAPLIKKILDEKNVH